MTPTGFPLTVPELRRRITQLMLFRVVMITLVFGTTVVLHVASPEELTLPSAISLFAIVAATYALTLIYAIFVRRVEHPLRFADAQIAGDLAITTALVHVTGGAQSGYVFFYPLSIIGAALVRYRRGAVLAAIASLILFCGISIAGWKQWLPVPTGLRLEPWELLPWQLVRQLVLNGGAFAAVAFLAAKLGEQLASAGQRLETQEVRTADLAALNEDIIRCLSSGLITVDTNGKVLTFNEAAGEILGIAAEAARQRTLAELAPEVEELIGRVPGRGVMRRGEITIRRPGGERVLGISVSPLTNHRDEPVGRIVNFQDLTELRRMEAQVRRGERLAVIGQLAAGVAHEIRNPLASISGSIELLRSGPTTVDEDTRALMDIVLREVDRLNGMITDLLEYARPREPVMTPTDVRELLHETVRVFAQDRTTQNLRVALDAPDAGGAGVIVQADAAQLRQVLWNLLRNAAESMPEGGDIQVELRVAREEQEWATVVVSDTGVGIAPDELDRIFDPFYTTKTRGSGLGLATVHRIVSEHGGTISVSSTPGSGTRFTIRLPLGAAAAGTSSRL